MLSIMILPSIATPQLAALMVQKDQRRGGTAHPLHGHQGLEPFNDMQVLIIDAIAEVGEPATFDQILQSVSSRWRGIKIRRRDGTPYTTDCRRAIQANLRTNPHQVSLFLRVELDDGNVGWRFSRTIEEAEEAKLKSKLEKSKDTKQAEELGAVARAPGDENGEASSASSPDSPMSPSPSSPDHSEHSHSLRPVRATRTLAVYDDGLSDSSEEELRPSRTGKREPSSFSSSSSSSSDTYYEESDRKSLHRRDFDDISDMPPAKRQARSYERDSSHIDLSASAAAHLLHGAQLADARFTPQGWGSPMLGFGYTAYGAPAVPQFLPHQMSLAHEQAQQLARSTDMLTSASSRGSQWSDRSSTSRQSISSSSTSLTASTSTLADSGSSKSRMQSPISSHPQHNMNIGLSGVLSPHFLPGMGASRLNLLLPNHASDTPPFQQETHVSH